MALKYATKSGNWSDATVWNGGSLPVAQDVVLANNYTVTIDQDIDLSASPVTVTAGSFVVGQRYRIATLGTTVFTNIGAVLQLVGCEFIATAAGTGTGTAITVSELGNHASSPAVLGGKFLVTGNRTLTVGLRGSTGPGNQVLELSTGASVVLNGTIMGTTSAVSRGIVVNLAGACTLVVNGNVIGSTGGNAGSTTDAVIASTTGLGMLNVTVNGAVVCVSSTYSNAIYLRSTSTLVINGDVYARGTSTSYGAVTLSDSPSTVTVTGSLYCGNVSGQYMAPIQFAINGCTYTQTGNIYPGYSQGGVYCTTNANFVLFKLTGNIVASGVGGSTYYGVNITPSAGSFINGTVETGACGGVYLNGGSLKFIGSLVKGVLSPTLIMISGGTGTASALLDFSLATFSFAGPNPQGYIIYYNSNGGGYLECTLPGLAVQGSVTYLWGSSAMRVTINGDISTSTAAQMVYAGGGSGITHNITINGSVSAGTNNAGLNCSGSSASTYVITGNVTGGNGTSGSYGVNITQGILTVGGNVTGGTNGTDSHGVFLNDNNSTAVTITITGNVTGGTTGSPGVYIQGQVAGSSVTVSGAITATASSFGVAGASGTTYGVAKLSVLGATHDHSSGTPAILYRRVCPEPTSSFHKFTSTGAAIVMHSSGVWSSEAPAAEDVRAGVNYGAGGGYTGTCVVPSPSSVVAGVPVDHTVGLAIIDVGTMPTAADMALAVRTELGTELDRLDVAVSTRNAATPPTATAVASAVRTELGPELARVANCATVDSTGAQIASFESA